jgi:hypothetical protein
VVVHDDLPGREDLEEVLRGSDASGRQSSMALSATSTM